MSGIYLTWLVDVLRSAGCFVAESSTTNGWQNRARSSGGFPETPLGIQWHHTASSTSPSNDLEWQINGCDDAPVGNLLLDRTGTFWPVAAGAANTAGKGGPLTLSRGTIPLDSANTRTVAIEVANNGVGENWPQVQVDAYFAGSNAINAKLGNLPSDVFTHAIGSGNGWTDRKIDPAVASSVQGPWQPRSVNSSGTWSLDDIRNECMRRAGSQPKPPTPIGDDDEVFVQFARSINPNLGPGEVFAIYSNGTKIWQINDGTLDRARDLAALDNKDTTIHDYPDMTLFGALGQVICLNAPGHDEWGNRVS